MEAYLSWPDWSCSRFEPSALLLGGIVCDLNKPFTENNTAIDPNKLKGQSSEKIFWVEWKNLFVIGPVFGAPTILDFGLVLAEIFVFENRLPGIVNYGESILCVLFTTQSRNSPSCLLPRVVKNIRFIQQKHHWCLKIRWGQNNKPILMKFSGKISILHTKIFLFRCNTFVLKTIYLLRKNPQNLTKLATPHIVYWVTPHIVYCGESHMKYTAYYAESKLPMSFTMGSHCYFRGVNQENLEDSPGL